jgi:hypothetical protein
MTHDQARKVVQGLEAHDHVLAVPPDLTNAKEWKLVRPIGFFRARVYVAFDRGKVASLRPDFTFD